MKAKAIRISKKKDGQTVCRPSEGYDLSEFDIELDDYEAVHTLQGELPAADEPYPGCAPLSDHVRVGQRILRKAAVRFVGETWWEDPEDPSRIVMMLRRNSFTFEVTADNATKYRGEAKLTSDRKFAGSFSYPSGRGTAHGKVHGVLTEENGVCNLLNAVWEQPGKTYPWYATLDPDE